MNSGESTRYYISAFRSILLCRAVSVGSCHARGPLTRIKIFIFEFLTLYFIRSIGKGMLLTRLFDGAWQNSTTKKQTDQAYLKQLISS